jgi:hypothetical protein
MENTNSITRLIVFCKEDRFMYGEGLKKGSASLIYDPSISLLEALSQRTELCRTSLDRLIHVGLLDTAKQCQAFHLSKVTTLKNVDPDLYLAVKAYQIQSQLSVLCASFKEAGKAKEEKFFNKVLGLIHKMLVNEV